MKVNRNRHGLTLHGAVGACLVLVGTALWLCASPQPARAQSAGMANLLQGHERPDPGASQREARARAERHRAEQREAERRNHQGRSGSSLSPDERRKLRQNLYDLGREMYQGS